MKPLRISKRNSTYQILDALKTNRTKRNELDEVFVEGITSIKSAVLAGKTIRKLIYTQHDKLSDWSRRLIASNRNAQLIELDNELYADLCDKSEPSELLATVAKESLQLQQVKLPESPFVVILDRPSNHGNLGSIIRSANAFGVDLLVTIGHSVDLYDPVVVRASMGSIFLTKVCHEQSMNALGNWTSGVKKAYPKLAVVGTDSKAAISLPEANTVAKPVILLIGNEAKGLSVELKAMADKMVSIPIEGNVNSLNVACAASIVMYEISKRSKYGDTV